MLAQEVPILCGYILHAGGVEFFVQCPRGRTRRVAILLNVGASRQIPAGTPSIWTFLEALKRAGAAVDVLFRRFDEAVLTSGFSGVEWRDCRCYDAGWPYTRRSASPSAISRRARKDGDRVPRWARTGTD
jgi:hypothetical protein